MAQILTQEEVDALRDAVRDGNELDKVAVASAEQAQIKVVMYDFKRPQIVSTDQFYSLRLVHETFVNTLRPSLFGILKTPIEINLAAVDQVSYGEFVLSISNPTFLALLNTNPNVGNIEMEMNISMVSAMIDILIGGDGSFSFDDRGPTTLEKDIMSDAMNAIMSDLKAAWSNIADIDFSVSAMESVPDYIQLTRPETPCLNVTLDVRLGGLSGVFTLCYPAYTVEAIFMKSEERAVKKKMMGEDKEEAKKIRYALDNVPLDISASIGPATITANQVVSLQPGDVISLNKRINKPINVCIENQNAYTAELGQYDGKTAIRILSSRIKGNAKKE